MADIAVYSDSDFKNEKESYLQSNVRELMVLYHIARCRFSLKIYFFDAAA